MVKSGRPLQPPTTTTAIIGHRVRSSTIHRNIRPPPHPRNALRFKINILLLLCASYSRSTTRKRQQWTATSGVTTGPWQRPVVVVFGKSEIADVARRAKCLSRTAIYAALGSCRPTALSGRWRRRIDVCVFGEPTGRNNIIVTRTIIIIR